MEEIDLKYRNKYVMKTISNDRMNKAVTFDTNFKDTEREHFDAVSVYDVVAKKLVLIFKNKTAAGVYVLNISKNKAGSTIRKKLDLKTRVSKNYFDKTLTFRYATAEHKRQLGDNLFVCLDDAYKRTEFTHKMVSEFNKR